MAWFAEAQARLTVNDCVPFGSMGRSDTSRAMFGAMTFGTTVPYTTASTSVPVRLARLSSSATQSFPSSMAV
jgi:hypothetical protein